MATATTLLTDYSLAMGENYSAGMFNSPEFPAYGEALLHRFGKEVNKALEPYGAVMLGNGQVLGPVDSELTTEIFREICQQVDENMETEDLFDTYVAQAGLLD